MHCALVQSSLCMPSQCLAAEQPVHAQPVQHPRAGALAPCGGEVTPGGTLLPNRARSVGPSWLQPCWPLLAATLLAPPGPRAAGVPAPVGLLVPALSIPFLDCTPGSRWPLLAQELYCWVVLLECAAGLYCWNPAGPSLSQHRQPVPARSLLAALLAPAAVMQRRCASELSPQRRSCSAEQLA